VIHCSYGPAGAAVIESTLMVLFGPTNFRTACTLPLTFRTYTRHFLIPHIVCCLIAEDKDIDLEGGWEIMVQTADLGETLHSLTIQEDLLETIIAVNGKRRETRNIVDFNAMETKELVDPANVVVPVSSILFVLCIVCNCSSDMAYKFERTPSLPRRLAGKLAPANSELKAKTKAGKPFSVAEFPIETVSTSASHS
jgi:hypothetical protein